jgi:hypothetical protein
MSINRIGNTAKGRTEETAREWRGSREESKKRQREEYERRLRVGEGRVKERVRVKEE